MNFEEARQHIYTAVSGITTTLFSSDRVIFPNKPQPNLDDRPQVPFVKVEITYSSSEQMALGVNPPARYSGHLKLSYFVGKSSGSKSYSEFIDLIISEFQTKSINGIIFNVPKPLTPVEGLDWTFISVATPFHFDTIT